MSRVYDALRQMEKDQRSVETARPTAPQPDQLLGNVLVGQLEFADACVVKTKVSEASRLVALTEPHGLGAEKFRALATRLENLRRQKEIKSLQVTSGLSMEGKSLVAANLAVTFAKCSRSKVLLLEGDLHRPVLSSLFGLTELRGLNKWWSGQEERIMRCIYRLDDMPLWFLSAGVSDEQPSHILQSERFAEAFSRLVGLFDWIIVDSTPMLPIADANLWSQLLDGTLLVVREGVASIRALSKGLKSLDNPKLLGIVLNEVTEAARADYADHYYGVEREKDRKV
jgi:capsular exopolysaccharide synthesis family protein